MVKAAVAFFTPALSLGERIMDEPLIEVTQRLFLHGN
jgi:hypothetical protein